MNYKNFDAWGDIVSKFQEPFQAMAELNIKTFQEFTVLKTDTMTSLKKPEEVVEKQIELAIENGHKALDYMEKSFKIYEKAMLSFVREVNKTRDTISKG